MSQAISVEASNYRTIVQAIHDIGMQDAGLTFAGSNLYEMPFPEQIAAAGQPYLVARMGTLVGFAEGGILHHSGDDMERAAGMVEPVWDFEVFALYSHSKTNPNYDAAAYALVSLWQAYLKFFDLNGNCAVSNPHTPELVYIEIGDVPYIGAKVTCRVYEILNVQYS